MFVTASHQKQAAAEAAGGGVRRGGRDAGGLGGGGAPVSNRHTSLQSKIGGKSGANTVFWTFYIIKEYKKQTKAETITIIHHQFR